jgi:phage tail-like protein
MAEQQQQQQETYRNFGFFVELGGVRAAYFSKISGLGLEVEVIEHREGGLPAGVRKFPGRTKINDITLEQGVTRSDAMWKWIDTAVQGKVERRNISVVLLGPDGLTEVVRWNFTNVFPRQVSVLTLDGKGNDVLIESMTVAVETMERAGGGAA